MDGYETSRFNALKHGLLSKYTVLSWEDETEYQQLLGRLIIEHNPEGPTEEHLVEELAGVVWRKRRLRLAEKAAHSRSLQRATEPKEYQITSRAALLLVAPDFGGFGSSKSLSVDTIKQSSVIQEHETRAVNAYNILSTRDGTYDEAASQLSNEQKQEWELHDPKPRLQEWELSLRRVKLKNFLERVLFPRYRDMREELKHQHLIREQAYGESLDPLIADGLGRHETRLDRKFDRILGTLVKYQSVRRSLHLEKFDPAKSVDSPMIAEATPPRRLRPVRVKQPLAGTTSAGGPVD